MSPTDRVLEQLREVDGVMIGRAAYDDPYMLADADRRIFGEDSGDPPSRIEIAERMIPYIERRCAGYSGCPGGAL